MNKQYVYLDEASTGSVDKKYAYMIADCIQEYWGNPSSNHKLGWDAKKMIEESKQKIAEYINCEPDEIYFTASGTQSNNWALRMAEQNKMKIYVSKLEHKSIDRLAQIIRAEYIPNNELGEYDLNWLDAKLDDCYKFRTVPFISVCGVNAETGIINDIKSICDMAYCYGGWVHSDMSQAIGHYPIDVKETGLAMMTFSSQKMKLPRGISVLYIRKDFPIRHFIYGGGQQNGYFSGTENQYMIYALGERCKELKTTWRTNYNSEKEIYFKIMDVIYNVCKRLNMKFSHILNLCDIMVSRRRYEYVSLDSIIPIWFEGVDNKALQYMLSQEGVYCSIGSACSSYKNEPSRVLRNLGLTDDVINSTVRFSFDYTLTDKEIDMFEEKLEKVLRMLKE